MFEMIILVEVLLNHKNTNKKIFINLVLFIVFSLMLYHV